MIGQEVYPLLLFMQKSGKIVDYWEGIKEERKFKKAINSALVL